MAATQITYDAKRLAEITTLDHGGHKTINDGCCAMELVSYIAHEPWSDAPDCTCPVLSVFVRAWNDSLPDGERTTLLLPLVPQLVGTRGGASLEQKRALMAADWLVRVHTPARLRLAGLTAQADALTSLPEIISMAQVPSIREPIEAAQRDAAAAGDAAGDAAWATAAAAGDAAWATAAAAGDAAGDAAWAAAAAAWAAARAAAWAATGAAARAAANKKLSPTKAELEQSALTLINRMIEVA